MLAVDGLLSASIFEIFPLGQTQSGCLFVKGHRLLGGLVVCGCTVSKSEYAQYHVTVCEMGVFFIDVVTDLLILELLSLSVYASTIDSR